MKRSLIFLFGFLLVVFFAIQALAHTPLCSCYEEEGNITCEGGFSDGSSAAGVAMKVVDKAGKVLTSGKMNEDSEFTFKKPDVPYTVVFDAGPGHVVKVDSKDITE